jgi:hypothetical protein
MKGIYLLGAFVFLLASCNEATKNIPGAIADSVSDSIHKKETPADTSAKVWDNVPVVLRRWEAFWKTKHPPFDLGDFYAAGIGKFEPYNPGPLDKLPAKNDTLAYPFSPDSTWRLDVYSYYGNSDGGEPHDVVFLIDVKTRTQYTVYYSGSGTTYEDGGWIDNHTFIITGHEVINEKLMQPFYQVYDLDKKSVHSYSSKHYRDVDPSDYIRYRLRQQ